MLRPEVYIQGERLDLFTDENISVVSSVQNIEDISRTFNDYSQSFTVPASPNNNRIFQHWYNFNIKNGFDARVRHQAHIDIQATNFKRGTIRLESCKIENNKPKHYKVTFFGQLIDLKNVIGDDYLNVLDFSDYDIDYTGANIITGLTTGFQDERYIFPLISTQRQWFYNSDVTSVTYEDKLANIAWNGSGAVHGLEWTSLRPALSIMTIIEAIETKYGITFSRDFFGTTPLDNLYLWLANQDSTESLKSFYRVTDYDTVINFQPGIGSFDNGTGATSMTDTGAPKITSIMFLCDTTDGVTYTIQIMNGDNVLDELTGTGNLRIDKALNNSLRGGDSIYFRIVTSADKTIDFARFEITEFNDDPVCDGQKSNFNISGSTANTFEFMPKMKVIDFLKSIISMYNLVVVPSSDNNFYVNTLDDWYEEGSVYDITQYVDTNEMEVNRSKIYREIKFAFSEPQTILAEKFKEINTTAYGDLETKLKNADGSALDGEQFEIELKFEQMLYEKLPDLDDDSMTNIVYGLSLDNGLDESIPEPHVFYAISRDVSGNPISIVDENGTKNQLNGNVFMPSHADSNSQNYSTCFGGEVNEHTGGINNNSLYKLFYEDYITDSFSIRRRKVNVDARLPLWMLHTLKLNDRLVINGNRFLINEMTVNVTTQITQLELLNDIYGDKSDIVVQEETYVNPTPDPTPTVLGESFSISSTGSASIAVARTLTIDSIKYKTIGQIPHEVREVVYEDAATETTYNGGGLYYRITGNKVIRIGISGIIQAIVDD